MNQRGGDGDFDSFSSTQRYRDDSHSDEIYVYVIWE